MADLVQVEPIALLPTPAGAAVFLDNGEKVIVFYIDASVGVSINAALAGEKFPRPLTHDLFAQVLDVFGATITHVIITKVDKEVFFARLFIKAENEIMQKKVAELDARPSDCIALAVRYDAPIMVAKETWDNLEDVKEVLEELRNKESGLDDEEEDISFS